MAMVDVESRRQRVAVVGLGMCFSFAVFYQHHYIPWYRFLAFIISVWDAREMQGGLIAEQGLWGSSLSRTYWKKALMWSDLNVAAMLAACGTLLKMKRR